MKKFFAVIATLALVASCSTNDHFQYNEEFILTGYSSVEARTSFDTPTESQIPFLWSEGDYIWLGSFQSKAIAEACESAQFKWDSEPSTAGDYHVFYNMTGEHKTAKVLAAQTADGNLGNDGDFGYAVADEYKTFCLEHKTAYLWFDTTSADVEQTLVSITVTAAEGIALAGECIFNYESNEWMEDITNASNEIVLNFGEGVALKEENEGIFAAMVTLPAEIGGTEFTVVYTFADGSTFTEVKSPSKDLTAGAARRIATAIAAEALVAPAPQRELRVLTFEDNTEQFSPYSFQTYYYNEMTSEELTRDYTVSKWSDLVPKLDYGDEMVYGIYDENTWSYNGTAGYYWSDDKNTHLKHELPAYTGMDWMTGSEVTVKTYQRQGEVLSNSYAPRYSVATEGDYQSMYGQYNYERYVYASAPASGSNTFCVHHGYSDFFNPKDRLSGFEFSDGVARVIESMDIANTSYAYYQLTVGFSFGVNYTGLKPNTQLKVVAYGYDSATDTNPTTSEFFLVKDGVVVEDWTKWDLTQLGAVVRVEFNMVGSPFDLLEQYPDTNTIPGDIDDLTGAYGLGVPGYFAYDNIAVWVEK